MKKALCFFNRTRQQFTQVWTERSATKLATDLLLKVSQKEKNPAEEARKAIVEALGLS